jgi:predicted metal-dependent peptidase
MDLPHSDDCFVVAFPAETTEAFLEGHVRAFAYFAAVPTRILDDNTKIAVARIAVDCSGSVNARQLRLFEAEVRSILEGQRPERVHVLYFYSLVQKVETYLAGEPVQLNPVGGRGTDFRPCFDWLEEHGIRPQTLVFLTDLCGTFPETEPGYLVLWASTERRQVPLGSVIPMLAA